METRAWRSLPKGAILNRGQGWPLSTEAGWPLSIEAAPGPHIRGRSGHCIARGDTYPWQPDAPGKWRAVTREFRDGHREPWWVLEVVGGVYGPQRGQRLVGRDDRPTALA